MQPLPPELALHGASQGPPPGMPATIQVDPTSHPDNQRLEQQLQDAVAGLHDAMGSPQADPVTALDLQKAVMAVQKVLADLHKEREAALGGGPATNFLRRNSGG